jgi:hypothetical protein
MLIAMSGLKNSGKDTAASVLINEYGFTKVAFADALREALLILNPQIDLYGNSLRLSQLITQFGWDKIKNDVPEVRRLMQVFGTEVGRQLLGENVWVDLLAKKYPDLKDCSTRYVITDCRFPNEAQFVYDHLGEICWIERPGVESDGHKSENRSMAKLATYFFTNDTTIQELEEDIRFLMHLKGVDPVERRSTE